MVEETALTVRTNPAAHPHLAPPTSSDVQTAPAYPHTYVATPSTIATTVLTNTTAVIANM